MNYIINLFKLQESFINLFKLQESRYYIHCKIYYNIFIICKIVRLILKAKNTKNISQISHVY